MYNFDQNWERRHTHSLKWDSIEETYHKSDLLPVWVADMDFQSPRPVLNELQEILKQGILGYTWGNQAVIEAVQSWQERRHKNKVSSEAILFSAGVVPSIALSIQAFTQPGDAIMIHDPVYPPFAKTVVNNQRKLVRSSLVEQDGVYRMDLADMEKKIVAEKVKLFVFCSPHNPGGRVWTIEELQSLGNLCAKYGVLIVSDEIHQDLIHTPNKFVTFAQASQEFKNFSITLTAATKTFNLAGIKNSMIFVENPEHRQALKKVMTSNCQNEINTFGLIGTQAAYNKGEEWLEELLTYLSKNIQLTKKFLEENMPAVQMMEPQGTYLIWLDFSSLGLTDKEIQQRLIQQGEVVLNPGISFGSGGTRHMRLNIACPATILQQALEKIRLAFADLLD